MQLPAPVRAAIGLAANVAEEARALPDRAIELPMLAVSTVLQMSLRAQQRYAALTARGDAVLSRDPGDEPPPWATFDAPPADVVTPQRATRATRADFTDDRRAAEILDGILGSAGIAAGDDDGAPPPTPITSAPTKRQAAKKAGTRVARKAPAKDGGKRISKPRSSTPSKFDDAGD